MYSIKPDSSISQFQEFVDHVYGLPNDRMYSSTGVLLSQVQKFSMRALKGIRKNDYDKVRLNLAISIYWMASIANRLHINLEQELWSRFPMCCSYCGNKPCSCKTTKPDHRMTIRSDKKSRPSTMSGFQNMFQEIYPSESRTLVDSGIHLAEEVGEVSEAIYSYSGQHVEDQFNEIKLEISDFFSCLFGVANSLKVDIASELAKMFSKNCHECHMAPCECSFSHVAKIKT
ncbi:MAG: hypothetical protein PHU42_03900 [Patescibacteria group bacterium]|nr:hypothetical protein [Patescibacteria group bacterium]